MLLLKQQAQAVNDRIPAKGCRHQLVKPLGQWHGKGKHVPTLLSHQQRQRRDHKDQQSDPKASDDRRDGASLQRDIGGENTELDQVQDEIDEAKRLLEEAHLEVQAAQSKVTEAACRVREAIKEMAKINQKPDGSESGVSSGAIG